MSHAVEAMSLGGGSAVREQNNNSSGAVVKRCLVSLCSFIAHSQFSPMCEYSVLSTCPVSIARYKQEKQV